MLPQVQKSYRNLLLQITPGLCLYLDFYHSISTLLHFLMADAVAHVQAKALWHVLACSLAADTLDAFSLL